MEHCRLETEVRASNRLCLTMTQDTASTVPGLQLRACLAPGTWTGFLLFHCLAGVPCKGIQDMENQTSSFVF